MRELLKSLAALPVCAALFATPAAATAMLVNVWGDWNDYPGYDYWTIEFQYNPAGLTQSEFSDGYYYAWATAPGNASIVHYAKASFYGTSCDQRWDPDCVPVPWEVHHTYDINDFNSFTIAAFDGRISFGMSGPGGEFYLGHYLSQAPYPGPAQPYFVSGYGDYGWYPGFADIHTHVIDVKVTAVPEPSTWALMITGFGLAGVALRRARRLVLAQKLALQA